MLAVTRLPKASHSSIRKPASAPSGRFNRAIAAPLAFALEPRKGGAHRISRQLGGRKQNSLPFRVHSSPSDCGGPGKGVGEGPTVRPPFPHPSNLRPRRGAEEAGDDF